MRAARFVILLFVVFIGVFLFRPQTAKIDRLHYQLQNLESLFLQQTTEEGILFVIDYSRDGSKAFTKEEINLLKNDGKNLILSYLSIGEAESYRFYFSKMPKDLVTDANPVFKDNYPVQYWDPRWQQIILGDGGYLKKIFEAGFDGLYLDIVDGYLHFPEEPKAAPSMMEFVMAISRKWKSLKRGPIFVQNASCIHEKENFIQVREAEYQRFVSNYFAAIDGIGLESTFFLGPQYENNSYHPQERVLNCLNEFKKRRKTIVAIEYLSDPEKQAHAQKLFEENAFIGLITDRDLKGGTMRHGPQKFPAYLPR